jgi:internalin A
MAGPARKWYVLSLRSAMLLVLACGLLSGWMGWRVNRANDQRRAVAAIRRAGGGVGYDHKGRPWAPAWLRKRLGDEFFQEVTSVQFLERSNVTDRDLAPLESLDRLEELAIHGALITDSGLEHISNLTELRILSLWETRGVSDAGLVHLAKLTKLQTLNLYRCGITDAGLVHLRRMTDLDSLTLGQTKVTGPGLSHLGGMSKLRRLFTSTDGAGLTHIGHLRSLQELYAYDTESPTPCDGLAQLAGLKGLSVLILGDSLCSQGLTQIAGHTGLTQLGIGGDGVTDAELIHVAGIKGLQELTVYKSRVTGPGLVSLEGLSSLTSLDLQDSAGVGDDGAEYLKKLSSIQTLGLGGTRVTDVGLAHLNGLKRLGRLVVGRGVTDAGITAIRQALPTIKVIR